MSPRAKAHAARCDAAIPSLGRVTGSSQAGGVGGRSLASSPPSGPEASATLASGVPLLPLLLHAWSEPQPTAIESKRTQEDAERIPPA